MFYRLAGVRHFDYSADRAIHAIPFERRAAWALLTLAVAAPFVFSSLVVTSYLLPWLVWTAAVLGLNLVVGWAGQLHLGYAAVMAVGAYTTVHVARAGAGWELAFLAGGVAAAVIGSVFAFAALRVKGLYLALTTLALQIATDWTLTHVPAISGGSQASVQAPGLVLAGIEVASDRGYYYVALAWCVFVTVFMLNLRRTSLGRAFIAVREKDYAAEILGVRSFRYKLVAFATSSFIGGVSGGVLIAAFYHSVTPEQFSAHVSIQALAMVVIGGLGSVIGSYLGVALILILPGQVAAAVTWLATLINLQVGIETLAHVPTAVYGALIILCLLFEPLGLGRIYGNLRNYLLIWPFGYAKK